MNTTSTFEPSFVIKNINPINDQLENNRFSSWYFGLDEEEDIFFLSIFDEHNPQEELIFTIQKSSFSIVSGHRYKKVKRSNIKEEHIKYQQAQEVLAFIKNFLSKEK